MTSAVGGELREVQILGFPVAIQARAQEHLDDLLREFVLIAADNDRIPVSHVPSQLLDLIAEIQRDYAGTNLQQEARLVEAREAGVESLDLVYRVPADAAAIARRLAEALDAADTYCLSGEHLLTLATPPEEKELRRWYLGQFVDQISGSSPTTWPDWIADHRRQ